MSLSIVPLEGVGSPSQSYENWQRFEFPSSTMDNTDFKSEPGILANLNTMRGLSDVLQEELDNLVPVQRSPAPRIYEKFCELFLLDADQGLKLQSPDEELQIPFTKLRLPSYQVWDAWFMLISKFRGLNGGILAYEYPSDSTTYKQVCLAACFVRALVAYSKADCKREWMLCGLDPSRERRHLSRDAPFSQRCPSGDPVGIQCYCSGGITRDIADSMSRGTQLIFSRKESIDEWAKLLEKCSPDPTYYEPLLIHHFYRENLRPRPEFKGKMEIKPDFRKTTPRGEQSVFDADWYVRPPSSGNPERQPERYIILVGQEAQYLQRYRTFMSNRLDDFGYNHRVPKLKGQIPIDPSDAEPYSYGAYVGLHIIDQFDQVPDSSPVFKLIAENRHIMDSFVDTWAVSQKPMSNGFSGLRSFLNCIERDEWADPLGPNHYKHPLTLGASELVYQKAIAPRMAATSSDVQVAKDHFINKLFIYLVCRRTLNSKWFGQYISKYIHPEVISFKTPRSGLMLLDVQGVFDQARADIRTGSGGPFNVNQVVRCLKTFRHLTNCQIVSTFPGAAGYLLDGQVDVSHAALEAQIVKHALYRSSLKFFRLPQDNLDELTADSPKLMHILRSIELMLGIEGDRMVITCLHLFEALLVLQAVEKRRGSSSNFKVVYLPSRPTQNERQHFSLYWASEEKGATRVVIVLADFDEFDLGLDRANWQVLTGPVRTKEQEARIFRLTNSGQQQRQLHHFLLCTEDNPADRLIISRQAAVSIASDPFDMNSPLVVPELTTEAGPGPNAVDKK